MAIVLLIPSAVSAQCVTELVVTDPFTPPAVSDFYGYSTAISGSVAVVGVPNSDPYGANSGSAYVFRDDGSGWITEQYLFGSDEATADIFGTSVAIEGGVLVVGAPGNDINGIVSAGAAYVFRYDGSVWVEEQKLFASDGEFNAQFGHSVSVSENLIVVGAYLDGDLSSPDGAPGAAYVFRFDGSTWLEEEKLTASDGASVDYFGVSVSISGYAIVIGAYYDDDKGSSSGSAYVFRHNANRPAREQWVEEQKLTASDGEAYDWFGYAVGISSNVIAVGSPQDDDRGTNFGSTYIFRFDGSTWTEEAEIYGPDSTTNDMFGGSIDVSGERLIVGACQNDPYWTDAGAAYVFRKNSQTWVQEAKLVVDDGYAYDNFGFSVGTSNNKDVVGAIWHSGSGSAWVSEPCGCTNDADCDDSNACTGDKCDSGSCRYINYNLNSDGTIGLGDVMIVISNWGLRDSDPRWNPSMDLNGDENIGLADIMILMGLWGEFC